MPGCDEARATGLAIQANVHGTVSSDTSSNKPNIDSPLRYGNTPFR